MVPVASGGGRVPVRTMAIVSRTTLAVVTSALCVTGLLLLAGVGRSGAGQPGPAAVGDPASGRDLWQQDCAICHGDRGQGSFQGPDIRGDGTAAVDFMVRSGRMPVDFRGPVPGQTERGEVRYTDAEIRDLVAYTASFVDGPEAPASVPLGDADLAAGGTAYRLSCAACHQAAGQGGALGYGTEAPPLGPATPVETYEAVRTGPGTMPAFPETLMAEETLVDVVAYVEHLDDPEDPGGAGLGHLGPVPEGLVAWAIGIGGCLVLCRWLGERQPLSTD